MLRELNAWNKERAAKGQPDIHMGVGLNTATVVAGNIGSPKRMDYTMIGKAVYLLWSVPSHLCPPGWLGRLTGALQPD